MKNSKELKLEDQYDFFVDEGKPWFRPESGWPDEVPKNYDFPRITLYEMLVDRVEIPCGVGQDVDKVFYTGRRCPEGTVLPKP